MAAVLSGAAEANYESAFEVLDLNFVSQAISHPDFESQVNVNGTYELLQACKAAGHCPTFVFTSSVAVFGKAVISNGQSDTWTERSLPSPQSSYGTQVGREISLLSSPHFSFTLLLTRKPCVN